MKLPEEPVAGSQAVPDPGRHWFHPLMIVLLVILLAALAAVVIWGEEIVNMILPSEETELTPLPEATGPSDADELNSLEAEMDDTNWSEFESDMNAIEASIEAGLESTTTATTTN